MKRAAIIGTGKYVPEKMILKKWLILRTNGLPR